jgi:hypothetical protein
VAFTFNASSGLYSLYRNGVLVSSGDGPAAAGVTSESIGCLGNWTDFWTGDISHAELWNGVLSTSQIGAVYAGGTGTTCTFSECPDGYTQSTDNAGNIICTPTSCSPTLECDASGNIVNSCTRTIITPASECPYGCSNGSCVPPPAPKIVSFAASPILVRKSNQATVTWDIENVEDCSITGNDTPAFVLTQPSGVQYWTGSQNTHDITGQTIFTLHCSPISGAVGTLEDPTPASNCTQVGVGSTLWTDQACTVNVVPSFIEK